MTCPICERPMAFIGSAGISDADGRWDAETQRYRCEGDHMLFVADAKAIDEAELD